MTSVWSWLMGRFVGKLDRSKETVGGRINLPE